MTTKVHLVAFVVIIFLVCTSVHSQQIFRADQEENTLVDSDVKPLEFHEHSQPHMDAGIQFVKHLGDFLGASTATASIVGNAKLVAAKADPKNSPPQAKSKSPPKLAAPPKGKAKPKSKVKAKAKSTVKGKGNAKTHGDNGKAKGKGHAYAKGHGKGKGADGKGKAAGKGADGKGKGKGFSFVKGLGKDKGGDGKGKASGKGADGKGKGKAPPAKGADGKGKGKGHAYAKGHGKGKGADGKGKGKAPSGKSADGKGKAAGKGADGKGKAAGKGKGKGFAFIKGPGKDKGADGKGKAAGKGADGKGKGKGHAYAKGHGKGKGGDGKGKAAGKGADGKGKASGKGKAPGKGADGKGKASGKGKAPGKGADGKGKAAGKGADGKGKAAGKGADGKGKGKGHAYAKGHGKGKGADGKGKAAGKGADGKGKASGKGAGKGADGKGKAAGKGKAPGKGADGKGKAAGKGADGKGKGKGHAHAKGHGKGKGADGKGKAAGKGADGKGKGKGHAKGHGKGKGADGKGKAAGKGADGKGKAAGKGADGKGKAAGKGADGKGKAAGKGADGKGKAGGKKDAKKEEEDKKKQDEANAKTQKEQEKHEHEKQKEHDKALHELEKNKLKGMEIVAAHGGLGVDRVVLVDTDTNAELMELKPGGVNVIDANPATFPEHVTLRADCQGAVKSVEWVLRGKRLHMSSRRPYVIAGHSDDGTRVKKWNFRPAKNHVDELKITAYSGRHGQGEKSASLSLKLKVINGMIGRPAHIKPNGVCHFVGNGHCVTFNGVFYNFRDHGEYTLFKDSHLAPSATTAKVNIILDHNIPPAAKANSKAAFVTGVAIQFGTNTFEVQLPHADTNFTMLTRVNGADKSIDNVQGPLENSGFVLAQKGTRPPMNAKSVALEQYNLVVRSSAAEQPTHVSIRYGMAAIDGTAQRYMNVRVSVNGEYSYGHTNGLCSNFNGNKKRELIAHSGVAYTDSAKTAHTWLVPVTATLFNVAPPPPQLPLTEKELVKNEHESATDNHKRYTKAQVKAASEGDCAVLHDKKNAEADNLFKMCVDDTLHGEALAANTYLDMEMKSSDKVDVKGECIGSVLHDPWDEWGPCSKPACGSHTRTRTVWTVPSDPKKESKVCGTITATEACNVIPECYATDANKTAVAPMLASAPPMGSPVAPTGNSNRMNAPQLNLVCEYANYTDNWSPCSVSCGNGTTTRTRGLVRQADIDCPDTTETKVCTMPACPQDCKMTNWTEFTPCSKSCGQGTKERYRTIISQPVGAGAPCGNTTETMMCNEAACSQSCEMDEWGAWSACSATCGNGTQTRTRSVKVAPTGSGVACPSSTETRACTDLKPCSNDCIMSDWSADGECSCGVIGQQGTFTKKRTVVRPASHGGRPCGLTTVTQPCTITKACGPGQQPSPTQPQQPPPFQQQPPPFQQQPPLQSPPQGYGPMPCEFGSWSPWSKCNAACGEAQRQRVRQVAGMSNCGPRVQEESCHLSMCGNAGASSSSPAPSTTSVCSGASDWSAWNACSASCGSGVKQRARTVPNGCTLPATQTQPCSLNACTQKVAAAIDSAPQGGVILPVVDDMPPMAVAAAASPSAVKPTLGGVGGAGSNTIIQHYSKTTHIFNDNFDDSTADQFNTPDLGSMPPVVADIPTLSLHEGSVGTAAVDNGNDIQKYHDTVHHLKHRLQKLFKRVE